MKIFRYLHYKLIVLIAIMLALFFSAQAQSSYELQVQPVDVDANFLSHQISIPEAFDDATTCLKFVSKLPDELYKKGFLSASLDSVAFDSTHAFVKLFLGKKYRWAKVQNGNVPAAILSASGFNEKYFQRQLINYQQVAALFEKILTYCDNNGYPFAQIHLDSITILPDGISGKIFLDKGYAFVIDTIFLRGNAQVSPLFIQHYLNIRQGSPYDESRLQHISQRISELAFLKEAQPWNVNFIGSKTQLNLYLDTKKSSQFDFLIGFLPNNQQTGKLLLTGEANLNLQNAFKHGEVITANWQQLQYKSPALHLAFQYPYIFNSSFGIDLQFDLFRKDSSYLNLDEQIGIDYALSTTDYLKVFLQNHHSTLLTVDTSTIKFSHRLPDNIDVTQTLLGITYATDKTDYRINPRRGYEGTFTISAGVKNILKNNTILQLQNSDTTFNYASLYDSLKLHSYKLHFQLAAAKYFPVGKRSTIETAVNAGALFGEDIFRNELFQLGGYELLRGFDEQSIFASQYAVLTLEYHYLLAANSYIYLFSDNAFIRFKYQYQNTHDFPTGLGIGMAFQTKAGIFNISYGVGRRYQEAFNLRQSKIHFGYVNYF